MSRRRRRSASPYALGVTSASVLAALLIACGSNDDSSLSTANASFSGTYSADSEEGSAPFDAITFIGSSRYSYIAKACNAPLDADAATSEGDPANDAPASTAIAPCVHEGSYVIDPDGVSILLTDDGQTRTVRIEVSITAVDASAADSDEDASAGSTNEQDWRLHPTSSPPTLVQPAGSLAGTNTVTQFKASGTSLSKSAGTSLVMNGAIVFAQQWVNVQMPYCQAINHQEDDDKDCQKIHGPTCERTGAANNPQWNAYRSDCSGLVSYAWSLAPPGKNTNQLVPGIARYVPASTLQPGDALLAPGQHIGLFERWIDQAHGKAMMLAEPGCSVPRPYAVEQEWDMTSGAAPSAVPSAVWNDGAETETFFAIRKR